MSTQTKPKVVHPEYLTVKECQTICRFKGPEAIRRAVYRGDLAATRVRANRLLIKAKDFWEWFHRNDVKPPREPDNELQIDLFEDGSEPVTSPEGARERL